MAKINPKMAEDSLIQPFIHFEKGQCPNCQGPIIVLESEISAMLISNNGLPVTYNTESYKVKGYCGNCNRVWPVAKYGMEFEVVPNPQMKALMDRALGRTHEVEEIEPADDNPFIKRG